VLDELTGTAADTRVLVRAMRKQGAAVIVLLGGDGTVRAAAAESGEVPLLPLSTGTNNVFPEMWEATVAGTAAGLLATGRVDPATSSDRAKVLHVRAGDVHEVALVDVCVTSVTHVGSRALWRPETLHELYCSFAEPHAIGLSSIAGLLRPTARTDLDGVLVRLAGRGPAASWVLAPIAPGVIATVGVGAVEPLRADEPQAVNSAAVPAGTVAVDGEREIEFGPSRPVTVTLAADGPWVLDVRGVLAAAADGRLLVRNEPKPEVR
jgi:predicted polyphosphate/ATP-dependent NAD kinase